MPTIQSKSSFNRKASRWEVFYELQANKLKSLSSDIASAINKRSLESCLNMPDFLIVDYLVECFVNLVEVTRKNARWHK